MMSSSRVNIGIKRMGEIDEKAFLNSCKQRFGPEEAEIKSVELCSLWQEKLKNPEFHPFKIIPVDGKHEVMLHITESLFAREPFQNDILKVGVNLAGSVGRG